MNLFHTSAQAIKAVTDGGRFDEFLFFSLRPYEMAASDGVTYSLPVDENEIIDAGHLFFDDRAADCPALDALVAQFAARFDVDTDTAEEIISERQQLDTGDADDSWDVQLYTARAAKALGYRGVRVQDEQGSAYMIDMLGREAELVASHE